MQVPFLDLKLQYQAIKQEIDAAISEVIKNTSFVMGPYLRSFEESFARYQGLEHMIGTNSGTSALAISLLAYKRFSQEPWPAHKWEAIIPANTFFATAEAVVQAGGRVVLADIDEQTYNLDPAKLEAAISENTRVIIPVHLYGQPAAMDEITAIAAKHHLQILEDCAQAHGARYKSNNGWRNIGSFGEAAGFSFYPGKNLGAYGDGGAVGTDDPGIEKFVRMYRDHGSEIKYEHQFIGSTDRLASMQAAVLEVKLRYLDQWNKQRRANAEIYNTHFAGVGEVILPAVPECAEPVWHLFVIRVADRVGLQQFLTEKGIGSGFHYKHPLHLMPALAHLGYKKGDFPVTERVMKEIISLPMFPELTGDQIKYVVDSVKQFLARRIA